MLHCLAMQAMFQAQATQCVQKVGSRPAAIQIQNIWRFIHKKFTNILLSLFVFLVISKICTNLLPSAWVLLSVCTTLNGSTCQVARQGGAGTRGLLDHHCLALANKVSNEPFWNALNDFLHFATSFLAVVLSWPFCKPFLHRVWFVWHACLLIFAYEWSIFIAVTVIYFFNFLFT